MRLRRPVIAAAVALGIVLAIPGVASAHSGFTSGVPEPGSELGTTPGVVVLRFSELLNVTGGSPTVPSFIWDSFRPFTDARVIGHQTLGGVKTDVVAFFNDGSGFPIWFRLWIDDSGLVHRAEMRALGHFMDETYFAFDKPISIVPPVGTNGGANG